MASIYDKQIKNRNFLSPTGFKFIMDKAPKVSFFGNQVNIPQMTLGVAEQPTYLRDIPLPGDKIQFEDFSIRFLVDENLDNYLEIFNWMRALGYPESLEEIKDWQKKDFDIAQPDKSTESFYSDATLEILTSTQNPNFKIKFQEMWPTSLSTLEFDATDEDISYLTADATFKYTLYNITDLSGNKL